MASSHQGKVSTSLLGNEDADAYPVQHVRKSTVLHTYTEQVFKAGRSVLMSGLISVSTRASSPTPRTSTT
jgi:hypothetical protein